MLGRLQLTVSEALGRFRSLSKDIFRGHKPGALTKFLKGELIAVPFYDGRAVSTQVKKVLREMQLSETELLRRGRDPKCNV